MLELLRRYQTYIFGVVAVVIILSFSFFGTYNTLPADSIHEQVAFQAVDETQVMRSTVEEMALFIGTDAEDKWLFGGIWGPNFLNDGVIKNDFLATGLAKILVEAYPNVVAKDLENRLAKEKRFVLYAHPQAKFISAEGAWAYFAPEMKAQLTRLQKANNAVDADAFDARTELFLAERQFPSQMLRQVLMYQQKQYNWVTPDPLLNRADLSLFGYHTVEDWYGTRFVRLVSEFIINSSKLAEQKGYDVSKLEALADLRRRSDESYQQNLQNPQLGVANSNEYFKEQLRRMGMDQTMAVRVWRQVLLFRRLFQDVGNAVVIDPLINQQFYQYAKETAKGDLYRLPKELHFGDYRSLQKFETYLDAISKRGSDLLTLPTSFLTIAEVKKKAPELVQKRYEIQVAKVQKGSLQTKVGLKEMWNWESSDANWETLKTQFPVLGVKDASNKQERIAALDSLDDATRVRVDAFARSAVIDAHPEWLAQTLKDAEEQIFIVSVRPNGGSTFVDGLKDRSELIKLLDQAPLPGEAVTSGTAELAALNKLNQFTGDGNSYYRIAVLERGAGEEILTYAEANKEGVLDELLDRQLDAYYQKNRDKNTADFQKEDGSWKVYGDVKDRVADLYFAKVLQALSKEYATASGKKESKVTGDLGASVRFYPHTRVQRELLQKGSSDALISDAGLKQTTSLKQRGALADQWKLEKVLYQASRSVDTGDVDKEALLLLQPQAWTKVTTPVNGDMYFFQLQSKELPVDAAGVFDQARGMHQLVSDDAQRHYMERVVRDIKEKGAISLDYLNANQEEPSIEPEESST
ncbi:MAG: hypothetical protein H0X51_02500 [Parachlamydiaceae bacterium]|nr:hypothetical protein [Parachlamydiaceae bacterium]